MASEVDICNVALGYLGDSGTVASIDPPEGSAQADHCARFYPIARDTILSAHSWGFATRRAQLPMLASDVQGWDYAYVVPNDTVRVLAVHAPHDPDPLSGQMGGRTHRFVVESGPNGADTIYCNVERAVVHYTKRVREPRRFPPLFVNALTWHLASMLAGPLIKGDTGRKESSRCASMAEYYLDQARLADTSQRRVEIERTPSSILARR